MTYIPEESKVLYRSKDGKKEDVFDKWIYVDLAYAEIFPP
jgi:hypothetical protein